MWSKDVPNILYLKNVVFDIINTVSNLPIIYGTELYIWIQAQVMGISCPVV